jgi:3-methyladenine DNA glycosylase/8-oxoguanine DNA glycosylase
VADMSSADVLTTSYSELIAAAQACAVGRFDPTTRLTADGWWRATLTPLGPGTLHLRPGSHSPEFVGYGPGGAWLVDHALELCGRADTGEALTAHHPVVARALRHTALPRFGRTLTPYHDVLPIILGQRITAREAHRQWRLLCHRLGEPAPGPLAELRLPPTPQAILGRPSWWFHPLGIERSRAEALRTVARHASRLEQWAPDDASGGRRWLERLPGVGPWTSTQVAQISWGDPDSVIVGDYWLPHLVVRALTGRARGTDAEMLELLEPWRGQRARVVRLLAAAGHRVERRGPGRVVLPTHRW